MEARLFPATTKQPNTFFTFRVLEEFSEHNLTSKQAAYDYIAGLRRLTDGCFTQHTPVCCVSISQMLLIIFFQDVQSQFLAVIRIWRQLCLQKWTGQAHNILADFPHQMPGSLVIPCVACPEEGFNMEKGWERTPEELK